MDSAGFWNIIVQDYKNLFSAQESVIQEKWEAYVSEVFGYRKTLGEIASQTTIHIGSGNRTIPDIIVREGENAILDIELKQYNLAFDIHMEQQLKSYMDLLHISVGVLVCKKIYVYVYNYNLKDLKKIEIDFIENNPNGIEFIELFRKGNFSKEILG